ncbi:MAG: hypothetical protein NWE89_08855 [Candidatus Bathyarchaeota archaeon]|nr:hypothetical protein [Candidatus Bathyarchaeota archaeon]
MSSTSRRKMLAAQEDIANQIVELAKRKDMTVYQTVNDILEQAMRVEGIGLSLKQVVDERWMLERAKEIGFTFTIEQLLIQIVDGAFVENKEKFTVILREIGHWYGKYFDAKHDEPLQAFRDAMELFCLGDMEYSLEQGNRELSLTLIGEKLTPGYTELFSVMTEELLTVLGYKLKDKELRKGMLKLEMKR